MQDNNGTNKKGILKLSLNRKKINGVESIIDEKNPNELDELVIGRRIEGKHVKKNTLAASVTDLMNDVITHVNPNSKNEQIIWTKIQTCSTGIGKQPLLAIIIALAHGYQIFLLENDDFEEVVSVRKSPLKNGHLLPLKLDKRDKFSQHRPLFATIFADDSSEEHSINFLSLKSGKIILRLNFDSVIFDIDSSSSCFLVVSTGTIVLYNHQNLEERQRIKIFGNSPIYSLTENLLAFADGKFNPSLQSCGFTNDDHSLSKNQVITTARTITKTVSSIGGSLVSTLSSTPSKNSIKSTKKSGIVTIVNTESTLKSRSKEDKFDCIAHFCAHNDSTIGHLMFANGGQLILTGSTTSTIFNIFLLHFHPSHSSLSSIQHMYSLVRGNSVAKVIGSSFSRDNRWVAISTNHGTTHLFTITPYGGLITARTHRGKFMNKESRFEKTVGIKSSILNIPQRSTTKCFRTHPGTRNCTILRTTNNPHISSIFNSKPLTLNSTILAKQRIFSSENLRAWASDNAPTILNTASCKTSRQNNGINCKEFALKRAVAFVNLDNKQQCSSQMPTSLLMLEGDGVLTQYSISVSENREIQYSQKVTMETNSNPNKVQLTNEENTHKPTVNNSNSEVLNAKLNHNIQWELTRGNGTIDFEAVNPPLSSKNALMRFSLKEEREKEQNKSWLPFLEVMTYMGPHRRLWLGPQFSFNVHTSTNNSASLLTIEDDNILEHVNGMEKCFPVRVQKESIDTVMPPEVVAKIICDPWSSELDLKTMNTGFGSLKDKIDDAMKETNIKEQNVDIVEGHCQEEQDLMTLSETGI